jgi:hypothetical protein
MQFRVYQLSVVNLNDIEREEPDSFVITAATPREARKIAHDYRGTSDIQRNLRLWLSPSLARIQTIGTSSRKSPQVHLVSYVSP